MSRIVVFVAALLAGLAGVRASDFYAVSPTDLRGPPGTLIRYEGLTNVRLTDAMAYRILYRSTGMRGEPIAVSGMAIVPFARPPGGESPVVAWAHGTTGIVPPCAPSLLPKPMKSIVAINELLGGHFVIAATDYPGLGAGTMHPYLVGESEARAVLDSVRAVRQLDPHAGARFAVFGHSQGGHAALWTGQVQKRYAPELDLVGVAALAPATELGRLFTDDIHRLSGRILSGLVMESWSDPRIYGAPLDLLISRSEQAAFAGIGRECIDIVPDEIDDLRLNKRVPSNFLKVSPTEVEPWRSLIARNVPPAVRMAAPVYIAQGLADTTVDPPVTANYVARLCRNGSVVSYQTFPGKTHDTIRKAAARATVEWLRDRFAGRPAPDSC